MRSLLLSIFFCIFIAPGVLLANDDYDYTEIADTMLQSEKYASVVVNATNGIVLHKYNADAQLHPASLVKMMTAYMAFQAIKEGRLSFNTRIPVSRWAASQIPSKLWLKPGNTITVRDALYGIIIRSANDAAVTLAEAIAGTEAAFAERMTHTAHKLGMKGTVFKNASGLHHHEQVTTAFDMARLGIALRRDFPQFYPMFSKRSFTFRNAVINSHNRVLNRYRWADGLKTGYTIPSGFNLVSSASRPEGRVVAVVLGGTSAVARDNHMIALLDNGFDKMTAGKHGRHIHSPKALASADQVEEYEVAGAGDAVVEVAEVSKASSVQHSTVSKSVFDAAASSYNTGATKAKAATTYKTGHKAVTKVARAKLHKLTYSARSTKVTSAKKGTTKRQRATSKKRRKK